MVRMIDEIRWGPALAKAMRSNKYLRTQTALSRRSGVSQTTIGRILRGQVDPQSGNLQRLARALGMPFATFVYMAEDTKMEAEPPKFSERVPHISTKELYDALVQALACWDDRRRGDRANLRLRRKERNAIQRLKELVQAHQIPSEQGGG